MNPTTRLLRELGSHGRSCHMNVSNVMLRAQGSHAGLPLQPIEGEHDILVRFLRRANFLT